MPFALIMRLMTGEAGIFFARLKKVAAAYAMAAIFALITVVFLVIAAFTWSAMHIGTIWTALIAAVVFLFFALVAFFVGRAAGRPPRTQEDDRLRRDIASIAGVTALSNAPQIMRLMKRKRGLIIVPAVAAGFLGLYKVIGAIRDR